MPLIATNESHSEPIEQGTYQAVCYSVIDLGTQHWVYQNKPNKGRKVLITWEIPELRVEWEKDGKKMQGPKVIGKEYTLSLGDKANLRKDLVAWRGKPFTAEELKGFDLFTVLGANCLLQVVHNEKGYAKVNSISGLMKTMPRVKPENPLLKFDMTGDPTNIPPEIPNWIVEKIKKSDEYGWVSKNKQNPAFTQQAVTGSDGAPIEEPDFSDPINDDLPF
jgi:hypothetical protein